MNHFQTKMSRNEQDILLELQHNKFRVKDTTVTLALNELANAKPKKTYVPETLIKKHARDSSDDDESIRTRKTRAIQTDSDRTPDLSNIEEDDAENNLAALTEAVSRDTERPKFFKLDKKTQETEPKMESK